MYTCGVTVYDYCHIGHARSLLIFDFMKRYLEFRGYKVKMVRNITDVDDKIINKAKELSGKGAALDDAVREIASKYIDAYYNDLKNLGVRKTDYEPKATEHIPQMITFIKGLIEKGFAYQVGGDVYFDVRKFPEYGKLSGQSIDKMFSGARITPSDKKKDPLDFALWKGSGSDEPGWDSPWGRGRPGWHIECSVMANEYLGKTLDIHGGGRDLIFPHHENELTQSESLNDEQFSRFWVHHELVWVEHQKMSKSLGNFITIDDFLKKYPAHILKMMFLEAHYRSPFDFSFSKAEETKTAYERIESVWERFFLKMSLDTENFPEDEYSQEAENFRLKFIKLVDDDFNTPAGLSIIFKMVARMNGLIGQGESPKGLASLYFILRELLDIFNIRPEPKKLPLSKDKIERLINEREKKRRDGDYKGADKIRDELQAKGVYLEDTKEGTVWRLS